MERFSLSKQLKNGIKIELYMSVYGINYCITAFTPDYRVIETKKTDDYNLALHKMVIMENKYSDYQRKEGK